MSIAMTRNYSADTLGAKVCIEQGREQLLAAAAAAPVGQDGTFRMADYGAADGGTALDSWRAVQAVAGQRPETRVFELVANDLPANDFNALAESVCAFTDGAGESVRATMAPRSFYEPIAPAGSVSLAFSATAMHWLRTLPQPIDNHTHANALGDEAVQAAFAAAAREDYEALLVQRARELAPGGELVMVNLARDERGRFLGHNGTDHCVHDTLHTLWKELHDEGAISAEEYVAATFQNFYKSEAEFTDCLSDAASRPYQAGLRLVESRIQHIRCPYRIRYGTHGNARLFADELMRTVRSWSEHTFRNAISGADKAPVDELYARFARAIATDPERWSMDYIQSYLRVRKEA